MPTTFRPYEPNQTLLLPPDLRDWLPPDHLAYDIADLVDTLDLAPFYAPYEGDGRRNCPYEPAMMVKILLYAYATGTFSSRTMARKLEEDVAFRVLAAGNFPRHRTLCEFRRRHLADFAHLFREVVQLARELGLVELGGAGHRRHQAPSQRLQAQSHELWPDAAGGAAAADRDRRAAGAGRSRRCGRGRPLRPRPERLRAVGRVAAAE